MLSSPNCNLIVVEIRGFNVWFIVLCFTLPEKCLHGGNGIRQGFVRKKFSCNVAKREELFFVKHGVYDLGVPQGGNNFAG